MSAKERTNAENSGAKKRTTSPGPPPTTRRPDSPTPAEPSESGPAPARLGFPVVGIGASAGGLDAFMKFFKAMPAENGMAFILIPHLDPNHDSLMVELLARQTQMEVSEACEGQEVQMNHIYIIPPNKFMAIRDGRLLLSAIPEPRGRQMSLDSFFRSLAEDEGDRAIGIVLSGTGNHGTLGLKEIKLAGGMAMVQQPESADFDQMPASAIATGLVDYVLPPERMPEALIKYVRHPHLTGDSERARGAEMSPDLLNRILVLLRIRTRYDFRCYRKNMLMRRIYRRMGLWQMELVAGYLELLRENPDEVLALYKDLLIGVTSFFRDPEAFQVLEQRVVPELVERNGGEVPVRVWVPGCATGEEAYSIAILLFERFAETKSTPNLQIFASDLDEEALRFARAGIYPNTIAADLSPERLRRFFTKADDDSYQVNKRLRESVVFAPQNLIGDAPFSKLDLISCRNLLIYIEPEIQKKILSLFHFALNAEGFLMLGPSETVGRQGDLFALLSARWRVYRKTGPTRRSLIEIPIDHGIEWRLPITEPDSYPRIPPSLVEVMQKRLLSDYAPASVLISRKFEVLCFQGPTVKYLEFPSGEPTRDLLALARAGLRTRLRTLVVEAIRTGNAITDANIRVKRNETYVPCQVTVKPFQEPKEANELLLVVFEDRPSPLASATPHAESVQESSLLSQLENELKATREDLQGMIEELESSNEEMKASNEEMMSMNEEMQSVNEELETSKEELQSTNEELNTVNNQLNLKLAELNSTNNDITNLLDSTDIPTIFLAMDLRIRRFTPSATKLFHLLPTDMERPIDHITRRFSDDQLLEDCRVFVERPTSIEREVRSHDGRQYQRRILPYRTADHAIEGAVITFIDVTERKQAAELVIEARSYFESIVAAVREPLVVLDASLRVRSANQSFHRLFQVTPRELENRLLSELANGVWDIARFQSMLPDVLTRNQEIADFEAKMNFDKIGERMMLLNARAIPSLEGRPPLILVAIEDITERKRAEQELKELNLTLEDRVASRTLEAEGRAQELARSEQDLRSQQQLLQAILQSVRDGVIVVDTKGKFLVFNPAAAEIVGVGPAEIKPEEWQHHYGIFLSDQVTPCPVAENPLVRAIQGEEFVEVQLFVKNVNRPKGVWLSVVSGPLRDHDGSVIGGVGVLHDITESKRAGDVLRDSEERLRAIVNTAADAIITIDEQGIIESCNPATERMFDYPTAELSGRNIKMLMPSPYLQEHDQYLAHYMRTGDRRVIGIGRELSGRRKDGSIFPIDLAVSEIHVGSRRLFTGIVRDISERKTLQQELLSIAEEEQRRIGQDLHDDIGQELTGLAMKAETLHEIVVERQVPESAFAAEIVAGLDRTRGKVRALSRGMVSLEVESNGLVSALEELTARLGALHGVTCLFECSDRSVEIDSRRATHLYHIAQEAIANAIKHGHAKTIRVTLEIQEPTMKLEIRDDGNGMPKEVARPDGMGLRIMSYRAGLIDGKLTITGNESGGTLVSCLTSLGIDRHVTNKAEGPGHKS